MAIWKWIFLSDSVDGANDDIQKASTFQVIMLGFPFWNDYYSLLSSAWSQVTASLHLNMADLAGPPA